MKMSFGRLFKLRRIASESKKLVIKFYYSTAYFIVKFCDLDVYSRIVNIFLYFDSIDTIQRKAVNSIFMLYP